MKSLKDYITIHLQLIWIGLLEVVITLSLWLPVPRWAVDNTDLPLNSNIPKVVRENTAFTRNFCREYWRSFLIVSRLIDFTLVIPKLLFKVYGVIDISKIKSVILVLKRLTKLIKFENHSKSPKLVIQLLFK